MPACTFTFSFLLLIALPHFAMAQEMGPGAAIPQNSGAPVSDPSAPSIPTGKHDDSKLFDQSSPYLEYGDFNMSEEENEDALFFQSGRFFGFSLGVGNQMALGNRGKLYGSAFPRFDARIHYWFDFHFAMDMGVFFATHSFDAGEVSFQEKIIGYGFHLKYYFDVKDASAALTFANPFIEGGAGAWSKTESRSDKAIADPESTFSADFGGGLEFPISHKKTYFILEALYHTQDFSDTTDSPNRARAADLSGGFLTVSGHLLFVW